MKRVSCLVLLVLLCGCERNPVQAPPEPSGEIESGVDMDRPRPEAAPVPTLDLSLPKAGAQSGDTAAWQAGDDSRFSGLIPADGSAQSGGRISVKGKVFLREGEALQSPEAIDGGEVRIEMKTD